MNPSSSPVPAKIPNIHLYLSLASFVLIVVLVQIVPVYGALFLLALMILCSVLTPSSQRAMWIVNSLYIAGYCLSQYLNHNLFYQMDAIHEVKVSLSRFSLLGYILPFVIWMLIDRAKHNYIQIGQFTNTIHTPLIWRGIKDPIWRFLLIAISVMTISFSIFIDFNHEGLLQLLGYGVLFALVNSVLEELLWRGYLLSKMVDYYGEVVGLITNSIGFGLYHYALGFPWIICILFTFCGMLLGGVAVRSGGLLPVMLLHFWMNILFVLSGLIF